MAGRTHEVPGGPDQTGKIQKATARRGGRVSKAELSQVVDNLVNFAIDDATRRTDGSDGAKDRVTHVLERRLRPAVTEAHSIADQLSSPRYKAHERKIQDYLDVFWGREACPDGRLIVMASGDAKVVHTERTLGGIPDYVQRDGLWIPGNPETEAAIITYIRERQEVGDNVPEIVELVGGHGNSENSLHGCGEATGEMVGAGHAPELSMQSGGIPEYYLRTAKGWKAFDNLAHSKGAIGTTFDEWHDAHTQGLVYGLRDAHTSFLPNLQLRQNLERLADMGQILMTERLAKEFKTDILAEAAKRHVTLPLNVRDYDSFADNAITISEIALSLTKREEKRGFPWIPISLREHTQRALRTLGYSAMRNAVYLITGDIKEGEHSLIHHPEKLMRLGPIGADFNVDTIAFIQATSGGRLTDTDILRLGALYNLSYNTLREQGVDLRDEARLIRVTAAFDPRVYRDDQEAKRQQARSDALLQANAGAVRSRYERSIRTGETVVLPCEHDPETRKLTRII